MECDGIADACGNEGSRWATRAYIRVLQNCFPFDERSAQRRYSFRRLTDAYASWRFVPVLIMFGTWPLCAVAIFFALRAFAEVWYAPRPEDIAVLPPPTIAWALPATFVGLLCAGYVTEMIVRFLLGERFDEYCVYEDWHAGYDSQRARSWIVFPFAFLAMGGTLLLVDTGARVTKREIVVNRFFGIGETHYLYADVVDIVELRRPCLKCGAKRENLCTVVFFKQGVSCQIDHGPDAAIYAAFVREISQRSQRPILKYDTLDEYERRKKLKGKNFRPFG